MRGADLLAQAMNLSGVEVVFSLSGNQIMPLYDALLEPGIRLVHTRHEAAAVFMAEAYAQVLSKPGVALVTAAPGFANTLGALYSASMSETPLILLSGDSPVASTGKRAFQEFPQVMAASPFVKFSQRVEAGSDLAAAWQQALSCAVDGTPGPVHLALPFDVLQDRVPGDMPQKTSEQKSEQKSEQIQEQIVINSGKNAATDSAVELLDDLALLSAAIASADRPLVITGPALNQLRAGDKLSLLQERWQAPVVCMESPRGLSDPSLGQVAKAIGQADCVVLLGKKPDFTTGFAAANIMPAEKIIVVETDAQELEKSKELIGTRCSIAIHAAASVVLDTVVDAGAVADQSTLPECLHATVETPQRQHWIEQVEQMLKVRPAFGEPTAVAVQNREAIRPDQFLPLIRQQLDSDKDVIIVCDGGEFGQWAQAILRMPARVINGPSGAIGASLPYAIGASIAKPDAIVLALLGDGTAGFHLAEFETAAREQTGFVAVIGNDSKWNAEHLIQVRDYGEERTHSCELATAVRYDKAAAALGAAGVLVDNEESLVAAMSQGIATASRDNNPVCINVLMSGMPAPSYN